MRTPPKPAALVLGLAFVALGSWQVWAAITDGTTQAAVTGGGGFASHSGFGLVGSVGQPVAGPSSGTNGVGENYELWSGVWPGAPNPVKTAVGDPGATPAVHRLLGAWPNPFNPRTEVRFELASTTRVRVRVHDVRGRLVRTLTDELLPSGQHQVIWDGTDRSGRRVASGTYYLRLEADDRVETRKVSLLK